MGRGRTPGIEVSVCPGAPSRKPDASIEVDVGSDVPVAFTGLRSVLGALDALAPDANSAARIGGARAEIAAGLSALEGSAPASFRAESPESSDEEARFALPDLCLGRGPDGAVHPILSSIHHQPLTSGWLFTFHPEASRVERVAASWVRTRATWPLVELATGRHNKGYYSFPGPRAAHSAAELHGNGDQAVFPASELTVAIEGARPTLRGPDGSRVALYLPLADLTLHVPFTVLSPPPVVFAPIGPAASHTPRIDLGGATYQRERWEACVGGWRALSGLSLFAAMQRLRVRLGLPRFVFARAPGERKPFLVDTNCPFAAELLKTSRRGRSDRRSRGDAPVSRAPMAPRRTGTIHIRAPDPGRATPLGAPGASKTEQASKLAYVRWHGKRVDCKPWRVGAQRGRLPLRHHERA
jgi:hypothetical protein